MMLALAPGWGWGWGWVTVGDLCACSYSLDAMQPMPSPCLPSLTSPSCASICTYSA
jgi:hypothetical protein